MSLRIAWACKPRNISLGIAAHGFVYVGTIILYIINWFFAQRVVRAQHQRFGWSQPYRIIHRLAIVLLILSLIMMVVGAIQQFFTLNENTLRIDRALQLQGQTYFAVFCFAPILLLAVTSFFPRRRIDRFGAGRLRINVVILLLGVLVLSVGQIFGAVTSWLPRSPLRNAEGQPLPSPWYFSKACFYVFKFSTELFVVILYAVARVDLRFHIPDGSKKAGDYSRNRESRYYVDIIGDETKLKRASTQPLAAQPLNGLGMHPRNSTETIQEFDASIFDDTRTLADSLKYPSSFLEVDPRTGHWKIKRVSQAPSASSIRQPSTADSANWDPTRNTYVANEPPPVPNLRNIPSEWPLRGSEVPRDSISVMEHPHRASRSAGRSVAGSETDSHRVNGNPIEEAIRKLEANSDTNKQQTRFDLPDYDAITPVNDRPGFVAQRQSSNQPSASGSGAGTPRKHVYQPSPLTSDLPQKHTYTPYNAAANSSSSSLPKKSALKSAVDRSSDLPVKQTYNPYNPAASSTTSDLPRKHNYQTYSYNPYVYNPEASSSSSNLPKKHDYAATPAPAPAPQKNRHSSAPTPAPGSGLPQKRYYNPESSVAGSDLPKKNNYAVYVPPEETRSLPPSSHGVPASRGSTSFETSATEAAEQEFRRFSFEAPPRRGEEGYEGGSSESEREYERRYTQQ